MNTLYPYFIALLFFVKIPVFAQESPELTVRGERKILVVKDQPFLMLGGELGNSGASDMSGPENIWSPEARQKNEWRPKPSGQTSVYTCRPLRYTASGTVQL